MSLSRCFGEGFGEGFDVMIGFKEQEFNMLADQSGETIVVVALTQVGTDPYGDPLYTESPTETKGFAEQVRTSDRQLLAGALAQADIVFRMKRSTVISERGYEVEYLSQRFKVMGIEYAESHMTVYGERKVS